ncbi:hypothetical protein OROMI_008064 [Orobanche minor]
MANSVLLSTLFPLSSNPKYFHFRTNSTFTYITRLKPFNLYTGKFPKSTELVRRKIQAIGKTDGSSRSILPEKELLVGEDSAVFELAKQKISSWVYFTGVLGVVLFILEVAWIDNSTGFGKDFINAVSTISDSLEMADPTRPEFDILDSEGLEYHRWVSDVEMTFFAKEYSATLLDPTANGPSDKWNEIRLLDYKRVNDFNKDMLRLKARLNFCGKEITEDDMIQKMLYTFPTSALILANQYRLEYDNKRITTFSKLINLLQVAERHNEVLVDNNARPAGTKQIPEANFGKMKRGRQPDEQGTGRANPKPHGTKPHVGKGRGGRRRGRGRGGSSSGERKDNAFGLLGHGIKEQAPPKPPAPTERVHDAQCFRCGMTVYWFRNCHASKNVAAAYKKYRETKAETQYMEEK